MKKLFFTLFFLTAAEEGTEGFYRKILQNAFLQERQSIKLLSFGR